MASSLYKAGAKCAIGLPLHHKDILSKSLNPHNCHANVQYEDTSSFFFRFGPEVGYILIMACMYAFFLFFFFNGTGINSNV